MKKHSALDFLKKSEWSHESRYFENTLQKDEASQICAHCPNCHKNNIQTAQNREKGLSQEASCLSGHTLSRRLKKAAAASCDSPTTIYSVC